MVRLRTGDQRCWDHPAAQRSGAVRARSSGAQPAPTQVSSASQGHDRRDYIDSRAPLSQKVAHAMGDLRRGPQAPDGDRPADHQGIKHVPGSAPIANTSTSIRPSSPSAHGAEFGPPQRQGASFPARSRRPQRASAAWSSNRPRLLQQLQPSSLALVLRCRSGRRPDMAGEQTGPRPGDQPGQ